MNHYGRLGRASGIGRTYPTQECAANTGAKRQIVRKTTRRPKTARVPRTRAGWEWSEAQFWAYIRSGLRQLSRRWPPLVRHVWLSSRRPNQSDNKRLRWEHQCRVCGQWFKRAELHVDHIRPCGPLRSWEDVPRFLERLLCEEDGLRIVCERCHVERHHEDIDKTRERR